MNSSWSINVHGSREGVIQDVKAAKTRPENAPQGQLDSVKEYIVDQVGELDAKFNGARVVGYGELDETNGRDITHIEIFGLNLSLGHKPDKK